jgi:hypothetical protein
MLGILMFTFLFLFVITPQDAMAANIRQNNGTTVPEYVFACWDGSGFADYPGGTSDLETTLVGVKSSS